MSAEIITDGCPFRVRERDGDRPYTVIGWARNSRLPIPVPIVIPDYLELGEPLPIRAEQELPTRTYVPEGM